MSDILTPDKLRELGLEGFRPGAIERIDGPAPLTAQALGVRDAIVLSALVSGLVKDVHFLPSASPVLNAQGASIAFLHENPSIVRIRTASGDTSLSLKPPLRGVLRPEDDPGSVYWDTAESDLLVLVLPTGVVGLEWRANGINVQAAETVAHVRPLSHVKAPLSDWAAVCPDVWLAAELRRYSSVGGSWHTVVAAGMLARLLESPGTTKEPPVTFTSSQNQLWQQSRAWARTLSRDEQETTADLALAEADALHLALDAVSGEFSPSPDGWLPDWVTVCHRRDDLASAFVILAEGGGAPSHLQHSLALLDRRGRRALFNVPRDSVVDDERLRRIRLVDPVAWWGSPEDIESVL